VAGTETNLKKMRRETKVVMRKGEGAPSSKTNQSKGGRGAIPQTQREPGRWRRRKQ